MSDKHIIIPPSDEEIEAKAYFEAVNKQYPKSTLKWEDLSRGARDSWTSRMLLNKHKNREMA